ncbi:MAG: protease SohB, partial [Gammaproteobacteria bacterium]
MEYFLDYLLFSAKLVTVIALLALPLLLAATLRRDRRAPAVPLRLTRLNDRLRDTALALDETLLPPKVYKQRVKAARKADKARAARSEEETAGRSFVCEFTGDLRASAVVELAEAVTGILAVARSGDEVIVALESAGGTIHGYGLAASQLSRIRRAGLRL